LYPDLGKRPLQAKGRGSLEAKQQKLMIEAKKVDKSSHGTNLFNDKGGCSLLCILQCHPEKKGLRQRVVCSPALGVVIGGLTWYGMETMYPTVMISMEQILYT
jgi:hypothetical protein